MRTTTCILALATLFLVVSAASAQGPMMGPGGQGSRMYGQDWGYGLSEAQQQTAQEIYDNHYAAMNDKQAKLYSIQSRLSAELYSGKPDAAQVRQLADQAAAAMADLYKERIDIQLELLDKGLPPNQVCGHMGGGWGGHMMMGPGGGSGRGWGGHMMGPGWN